MFVREKVKVDNQTTPMNALTLLARINSQIKAILCLNEFAAGTGRLMSPGIVRNRFQNMRTKTDDFAFLFVENYKKSWRT
jgi:hypothetical protein